MLTATPGRRARTAEANLAAVDARLQDLEEVLAGPAFAWPNNHVNVNSILGAIKDARAAAQERPS